MEIEATSNHKAMATPDLFTKLPDSPTFHGSDYVKEFDHARLTGQLRRLYDLMRDSHFRSLQQIADITGDPPASISANLRNLRKPANGLHIVNRKRSGDPKHGLFVYQLIPR